MATDDPEGQEVFERVRRRANDRIRRGDVLFITSENNILVNALQRSSAVVVQKSAKEGFGLSVTEALWKGKPVVASNVGGIAHQITDGENGFLREADDEHGFADAVLEIMNNPKLGTELGKKAKESVRKKFLMTRLLSDYLDLLNDILK
jgi:trehalose synthase